VFETKRTDRRTDRHLEWTSYSNCYVTGITKRATIHSPLRYSEMFICVTFNDNKVQHVTTCSCPYNDVTLDIVI